MPTLNLDEIRGRIHAPLETLAQRHRPLSDKAAKERAHTALHEAAHMLAAIVMNAPVMRVKINPSGHPDKTGSYGRTLAVELLPCEGAFISYVGHAWEELHGDASDVESDLLDGDRLADESDVSRDVLLHNAREFVRFGEGAIRVVAAYLLAAIPRDGVLTGSTLRLLVNQFRERPSRNYKLDYRWCLGVPV